MTFRLSAQAEADVEDMALYIAEDNPAASQKWMLEIYRRFEYLGDMPGMGVARLEISPGVRMLAMGNHLILYKEIPDGVEIVRVMHGARHLQDLL